MMHKPLNQTMKIRTYTGLLVDPLDPDPVNPLDVAHALGHLCRFTGHSPHFYSVAEHSIRVADRLRALGAPRHVEYAGLVHDAHEAYIGDSSKPLKLAYPPAAELDEAVHKIVMKRLNVHLSASEWRKVHDADHLMVQKELEELWNQPQIPYMDPEFARFAWLNRYHILGGVV